jgi:hypothetical protein
MRVFPSVAAVAFLIPCAHGESKDPLRFLPEKTDVVLKVEKPRALVESILKHDLAKDAQQLQIVRDFLDGADARRVFQLIAHFEKELGAPWPELLDKLAGGGIAGGLKIGSEKAPVALVLQGTDEKTVTRFFDLAQSLFEEETVRQGSKEGLARKKYAGVEVVQFTPELIAARVGDALLVANHGDAMKAMLDRHEADAKEVESKKLADRRPAAEAGKILPAGPLAWLWVNLVPIKKLDQAKDFFETPRANFFLTLLASGWLDVAKRSDFLAAGLYHDAGNFKVAIRMPAGRAGMSPEVEIHLPKDPQVSGSLPLLEPKGVLLSHSFYMDLDAIYKKRTQIFPLELAKGLEEGEKQISKLLIGSSLPKFLSQSGVYYRLVATQPEKVESYPIQPEQRLPAFAAVVSMRDPQFGKTMNALVHGAATALGTQVSYRSWEEEVDGIQTFGFSFPENGKFPDDPQKLHFNYQPTFAVVQDQYILASNKGICRELIALIKKEDRARKMSQNMQLIAFASGLGDYIYAGSDQVLASTILGQGLKLGAAKEQTQALFGYLQRLGTVGIETDYTDTTFRLDLTWKTKK